MVIPGLVAILAPIAIGSIMGAEALGGMLAGSIVSGFLLAIFMANAGGAWDNAKKFVELEISAVKVRIHSSGCYG
ncbi:MAG: hypothetical protein Ct9H300mP19_17620 [Dehalococcoidia bacterium]|nr:MAG: hypothetical protein Ct9H300mP19_17620 [Dehalococcoidia bacterium]